MTLHPRPQVSAPAARPGRCSLALRSGLLFLAALTLSRGPLKADTGSLWGRTVLDVRLQADADLALSQFAAQITQPKNQPLDPVKVSASLKNLYATGRFVELAADAEAQGDGVVLVFRARARYFVGMVRVEGAPTRANAAALASGTGLRLGLPFSEESLTQAKSRMLAALASNAYYQATVAVKEERHPESEETDLIFTVTAGRPARLSGIDFTGNPGEPAAALVREARWKTGIQLTQARLEHGLSRLHTFYVKRDHLEASAIAEKRAFDRGPNTERITVGIDAGPEIRIRVTGAHISASDLRSILPAYLQSSADPLTLLDGEQVLADHFRDRGYFRAAVKLSDQASSRVQGDRTITYQADLGPRGRFVGYRFQGNRSVPAADLAGSVLLQPAAFELRRGRFDQDLLDRSVQGLAALYQSRGFADVKVVASPDASYQGQPGLLFVTFNIEEGAQAHVRNMTIEGLSEDARKNLGSSLLTLPGRPYSAQRAQSDRDSIFSYLGNHGYAQAVVQWHASDPTAQHEVDVEYQVETGVQETIARVFVLGNDFTRDSVINRELSMAPGQALNGSALLQSQQRLYDLGLFNQVQATTQDPTGSSAEKTVLVGVEEAKRWTLGYGGGLDVQRLPGNSGSSAGQYGVSPRVSIEVDRLDLDGRPQTYTLAGHFSNLEKIGSTSYDIPTFLGHPGVDLRITGLVDQSRNVLTFNSKRQELQITLQKRYSTHSSLLARYNFRHVSVSNLQINPASVPLFNQGVLVATVGGGYVNDHRDNPIDATRGSYSTVDADAAWTGLGSSADFGRIIGQNSTYYRLGSHLILARNTRAGVEPIYGHTNIDEGVPLPERFFMGGADSDRAFSLNEAGPRDPITGYPLGGRAMFLNQVELRFPLEQNHLGLVLFEDAGNVFTSVRRFRLLKFEQGGPTDFDYDVQAAGVGVRYQTPVGPVRFDVAYSPDIPQFLSCSNQSVSVCPASDMEVLRLPRVEFVLSVGQSF
ncbi:MAG TPA: POTRA domain-containing protein [Terriglobia bacterium]|nr:POTRA domain-containing protein [Terriglobia bacterium]